jgi:hypothetical protein
MTVRPLAIKNSSMPNSTPLSVEMTISSSTSLPQIVQLRVGITIKAVIASHRIGAERRPMSEAIQKPQERSGLLRRKCSSQ